MIKILSVSLLVAFAFTLLGCGADTDVSSTPEYNFKMIAGTVWKTKTKIGLADLKDYKGNHDLHLLVPKHYDPTHPEYTPAAYMKMIAELPVGAQVRIDRLMQDHGEWGGLRVLGTVDPGTSTEKTVYLDEMLFAKNKFVWVGWSKATTWGVAPEMLEK